MSGAVALLNEASVLVGFHGALYVLLRWRSPNRRTRIARRTAYGCAGIALVTRIAAHLTSAG